MSKVITTDILPIEGENLKDFAKRVTEHFTKTEDFTLLAYIDKVKDGYSSKLSTPYSESGIGVPPTYNDVVKYLVGFFSSPKWESLVKIKMLSTGNDDKIVRFITREHPKNTILM